VQISPLPILPSYSILTVLASYRRHADSVVYLDPHTHTLVPARGNQRVDARTQRNHECPTCRRPWHSSRTDTGTVPTDVDATGSDEHTFITNDYFQMLARSLPGSEQPSAPPSPRRRLAQPVRDSSVPRGRLPSPEYESSSTPPNAEFVGSAPAPPSASNGISETAFAPLYFEKFFRTERELGRGGRGVVLLVQHLLDGVPLGYFACKRVPIGDDHGWLEKVLVEVQLLTQLSHQNLVSYRHVWLEDYQISAFGPSVPCAFILQQYCNGGDLHNYICSPAQTTLNSQQLKERMRRRSRGEAEIPEFNRNEPLKLHFDEIYSFFCDITAGLRFLHHNGFIHRDLKPSNCLLHTVAGETRVLVSDFGEVQYENTTRKSTGATGTISYCAPEVLQRTAPDGPFGNFTFKSDIFSLGMILHFLCFATLPYISANVLNEEQEDVDLLRKEILGWSGFDDRRKERTDLPPELYPFLRRLLSINPDMRPTADEVHRGVSTGRLSDLMPEKGRRRASAGGPNAGQTPAAEELAPGRRIQKLDTPREGNSPQRSADGKDRSLGPSLGAGTLVPRLTRPRMALRSGSHERVKPSRLSPESAVADDIEEGSDSNSDTQSPERKSRRRSSGRSQGQNSGTSNGKGILDSSIVLRPRQRHQRHATVHSQPTSPIHEHPEPYPTQPYAHSPTSALPSPTTDRKGQLLLPPAPPLNPPTLPARIATSLRIALEAEVSVAFRVAVLLGKLLGVLRPCAHGDEVNVLVIYPLVVFAVMEFVYGSKRLGNVLLLSGLFAIVVGGLGRAGALCAAGGGRARVETWDDGEEYGYGAYMT
jgi:serine/threonine protein kinase